MVFNSTTGTKNLVPANDRCENIPCMSDAQCGLNNSCFNGTCTRTQNFCNKTSSYNVFDDEGNWTSTSTVNRCQGAICYGDDQCGFSKTTKLNCQNTTCNSLACNASYIYNYFTNPSETTKATVAALNRCTSYPCGNDGVCQSGKCYNSVCLNQNQIKPTCNATTLYSLFNESDFTTTNISSFGRCDALYCGLDQYC